MCGLAPTAFAPIALLPPRKALRRVKPKLQRKRAASVRFPRRYRARATSDPAKAGEPIPVRWTAAAEARLANIPEFVRPMAKTGIEKFAREKGSLEVDAETLDAARDFFGM